MSDARDYVDRTVDVLALAGQPAGREALAVQTLALPGSGGHVCTGIQKLAQRWLMEFLTVSGSMPYAPARGCPFRGQLQRGQLRTTIDVEQAFLLSELVIREQLRAEDPADSPDDEVYAGATLTGVGISADTLTCRITLRSRAGETRSVILPLPVRV